MSIPLKDVQKQPRRNPNPNHVKKAEVVYPTSFVLVQQSPNGTSINLSPKRNVQSCLDAEHFHPLDPLRQKFEKASNALHTLWVDLHYRSCPGPLGESSRRERRK